MTKIKKCKRCHAVKEASEFREDSRYKDGLGSWCKECHRQRNSSWAKENRERLNKKAYEWREQNKEKWRGVYQASQRKHKEKRSKQYLDWAKNNKGKRRAIAAKRNATKRQATPRWADLKKIEEIYKKAVRFQEFFGVRMHVDHIVPLQHELVCGLHCEANLQILPGFLNESKRNFWWPDGPFEEAYRQPDLFIEPSKPKFEQPSLDLEGAT